MNVCRAKQKKIKALRLVTLGQSRKLLRRARALDEHKRFIMAVGSTRVPRIHALVRTALRCKVGIRRLVALVDEAGQRVYKPKGYDEQEMLRGLLFLRMGGARVAELAHRTCGTPSVSILRRSAFTRPLRPSPSTPLPSEVLHNIDILYRALDGQVPKRRLAVLMLDELKITEAARWCPCTNKILGFCREHSPDYTMDFETIKEVELLCDGLREGKVHLATEATVAALGALTDHPREYSARPILLSGTCKRESGPEHAKVISTVIDACKEKEAVTGLRVISVASDGESRRGAALDELFLKSKLSASRPEHAMLANCKLFNLLVGDDDVTLDKDYKHVMKRLRNLALRPAGFIIKGVRITPAVIRHHLAASGHSAAHIESVMNPEDKQDVVLMYMLLRDLWSLPEPRDSDRPDFADARSALRTFGRLCYYTVMPYVQVNMTLSEQLESLSAAAHLAIGLYTYDDARGQCMPPGLFLDIMHAIKNAYFCVAKTKVADPDGKFWLILLGTDRLETAFGILRSIVGNDSNVDALQLGTRMSNTAECAEILARFPEWDREPRRLRMAALSATGEVSKDTDHINPRSWVGDVAVKTVVLHTCWVRGRQ
ncbi:hypothetical protein EXIGLDRAFT_606259, partial [Exidia glandulosa HHB12029]